MKNNLSRKVAIIGIVGLPANYGGFEIFTEFLVESLNSVFDITVYCSKRSYPVRPTTYKGVRLRYCPVFQANGVQSICYDIFCILDALRYADSLLILGVGGCLILPFLRLFGCRKNIVVNIDGLEWRRNKWSKAAKWFLKFSEKCAVKYSDHVVGDNKVIADYVEKEYNKNCALIEYGADHQFIQKPTAELIAKYPFLTNSYAFSVCRIEPENNVHLSLQAFSAVDRMPFVIVGNWHNSSFGKNLWEHYKNSPNIYMLNPIFDMEILNVLRSNAIMYIHGHSCGGTNPSLIEAMFLGLPVITFNVNFNRETTEEQAFYYSSLTELCEIISAISQTELNQNAIVMKNIANRRYTWARISKCYQELL
jgi:glycosyltransferase involved in cell wall biosynthesis